MHDNGYLRWLTLCGLDGHDSSLRLAAAARDDFDSRPLLRAMLAEPVSDFINWWHGQDVTDWSLTRATGNTDWAWLALARAANERSESRWGGLG